MANDEMTPGEIVRALARIEQGQREHGAKLDTIRTQTTTTNDKVIAHALLLEVVDREILSLKSHHGRVVWGVFGLLLSVVGGVLVVILTR